jgi:hypothetical protein
VREAIAGGGKQSQMEESGRWWREAIAGGKQAMTGGGYRSEVAREESDCRSVEGSNHRWREAIVGGGNYRGWREAIADEGSNRRWRGAIAAGG